MKNDLSNLVSTMNGYPIIPIKAAISPGVIDKQVISMKIAVTQGPIDKTVVGMKIAIVQGPINKAVF